MSKDVFSQVCNRMITARGEKMKTAHTPGPWDVFCDEEGYLVTAITGMKKKLPVCEVSRGCFTLAAEANARLIAAAPDLLAACREAIDFIWAEMKENPDKEDMDGSIMNRLIELQTGLISVWRKAGGVK